MLSVFILCAGSGARWNNHFGVPKQLLTFGSEALVDRTARLTRRYGALAVYCVTTQNSQVSSSLGHALVLSHTDSLTETIWATRSLWSERNVFLLGDVFYSKRAISTILECERPLSFFGRPWPSVFVRCGHGEMFALAFSATVAKNVGELFASVLSLKDAGTFGNLWNLYQLAAGLPLGSSQYVFHLLVPIDDYTNDIDTPVDYSRRGCLYQRIALEGEHVAQINEDSRTGSASLFNHAMSRFVAGTDKPLTHLLIRAR